MILQGEALEVLKTLPDESVDCCVTSPPYYGLRDYGTGEWVGGDPNCNHKVVYKRHTFHRNYQNTKEDENTNNTFFKKVCPICGAVREDKQIGLEETPEEYIQRLVDVFHEVKRVMKPEGTLWVNIGDSYAGNCSRVSTGRAGYGDEREGCFHREGAKEKDLIGIPWMLAFALRSDGWYLRQDIIWAKPNPMPESVTDRCTKSHEYIFLLSKSPKYYYDNDAIAENAKPESEKRYGYEFMTGKEQQDFRPDGASNTAGMKEFTGKRNKRDVWRVSVSGYKDAHFATYPEELIRPCILAGCPVGGRVLDPFFGSGTTGAVATQEQRDYIGIELNPEYVKLAEKRLSEQQLRLVL